MQSGASRATSLPGLASVIRHPTKQRRLTILLNAAQGTTKTFPTFQLTEGLATLFQLPRFPTKLTRLTLGLITLP